MIESEKLVIQPLAYIRGRSFSNIFFIVDEAQNLTPHEIKTIISRAGENTKIVFTGDIEQIDNVYVDATTNGLSYVVEKMKEVKAVIGGEGNGGVIYPESHYGRDALVGIVLFLTHLSELSIKASDLLKLYPKFFMTKDKINLNDDFDFEGLKKKMKKYYNHQDIDERDGVKIKFEDSWLHIRKSNTEPIIRIYTEAKSESDCNKIIDDFKALIT